MIGIYKIENLVNHKCYIGQSINIEHRWKIHKSELNNNTHCNDFLQKAWNKYGADNFSFEIIEECNKFELNKKERKYIKKYNSYANSENGNGYNLTLGGDGNRQDVSVLQFDLLGNLIKEYEDYYIASQETNISVQSISGCCHKRFKCGGNFIWIFKKDYVDNNSLNWYFKDSKFRNIEQYDLNGNLIKTWERLRDIINNCNINPSACLAHRAYTCGGYIFKYKDDTLEINDDYLFLAKNSLRLHSNKPFYQVGENGEIINSYISLSDAVNDGWNERMINECCRGLRIKYKGYLWILQDEYEYYPPYICKQLLTALPRKRKYYIEQYNQNNELIKIYKQLKDVKQDNFLPGNVLDCCLGRKPQYKGYVWKQQFID